MNLSSTAQATLLLTSYFSKASSNDAKPLTNTEWGRFASWLKGEGLTPADLLGANHQTLLKNWQDSKISIERILALIGRGHSLALAVEKWQRAGLWVVTRSDATYPKRLKARLGINSPPVLFGCGDSSLLNMGGIAVVGSRKACDADLKFTDQLGAKAASQGIGVISGGARGVDETAMLGAIHAQGQVVGILADSLLRAATSAKWRKGIMDGNVVLVSPFYPEAGFNVGNAMARNKYIYCLADAAVVIHSGKKGGTLNGAEENLKQQWVPLWVKPTQDKDAANEQLVTKGGNWCNDDVQSIDTTALIISHDRVANDSASYPTTDNQVDLFANGVREVEAKIQDTNENVEITNFYSLFIAHLSRLASEPISIADLSDKTGLHNSQLSEWLTRSVDDGHARKLSRPVRYQHIQNDSQE